VARIKIAAIQMGFIILSLLIWGVSCALMPEAATHCGLIGHVIYLTFWWCLCNFVLKFWALRASINNATDFLKKKYPKMGDRVKDGAELNELSRYFQKSPYLAHAWQEFEEGVVVDESGHGPHPIFNSDNSQSFFDEYAVIESNMYTQFWVNLPGMFTAGGILGTFWGLVETLKGINGSGSDQAALNSVMQALPGMHTAFYCSLLGVGLYILFSLIERLCMSKLSRSVSILQAKIDSIIIRVSEQALLHRVQLSMLEQEAKFKTLHHTLLVSVGEEILKNQLGELSKQVGALLEQQRESTIEERQHQADYQVAIRESIQETLSPLFHKMNELVDKQADSAADKISGAVSGMFESLGGNLERASAEASHGFREAAERLGATLLECNSQIRNIGTELGDLNAKVRQSAEGLNQSATTFSDAAQKGHVILEGLSDAVTLLQPSVQAQQATVQTCVELVNRSESANDAISQMYERVDEQVQGVLGRLSEIGSKVAQLSDQTNSQTSTMSKALFEASRLATQAMETAKSALVELFGKVNQQMEGYKGTVDAYSLNVREGLSRIFTAFDQETERLVTAYAGVCDTTRKTSIDLASQTEKMCKTNVDAMKETSEALIKLSSAIRDVGATGSSLRDIDTQLKAIFDRVQRAQVA
jgi:hypothetical protein